jgi:hypothetical protein
MIPQDFPSCYYSSMRNLAVLVIHLIATLARLLGPGGVRSLVAESLLLKHQLLIVNRSWQRSPNLSAGDRIFAGLLALLVRPTRLLRSAIALKPSTLLGLGATGMTVITQLSSFFSGLYRRADCLEWRQGATRIGDAAYWLTNGPVPSAI